MSTSTGLLYAYAKNINNDSSWRGPFAFTNRDVADTWYRAVTESVAQGYPKFTAIQRTSLQWHTWNGEVGNIMETINDSKVALALWGQAPFTLLYRRDERILTAFPASTTQTTSMELAPIPTQRSSTIPNGSITRRRARLLHLATVESGSLPRSPISPAPPGTIIVSSDDVYITTPSGANEGITSSLDQLSRSANPFPFRFPAFHSHFQIDESLAGSLDTEPEPIVRNPEMGEEWELV
ncbi:hypothetical protein FRB96_001347 [Tulasnella sp. 330]|nr:hypothetical protein FRB96_001347 [Tulasnella sp. 330]